MSTEQPNSAAVPAPQSLEDGNFEDASEAVDSNSILSTLLTPGPPASELVQSGSRRNSASSISSSSRPQSSGSNPKRSNLPVTSMSSSLKGPSRDRGDPTIPGKDSAACSSGSGATNRLTNSPLLVPPELSQKALSTVSEAPVSASPSQPVSGSIYSSEPPMAAASQMPAASQLQPLPPPNPLMNPAAMMMMMGMANPFMQQMLSQVSAGPPSGTMGGQMSDPLSMMSSYNMNFTKYWHELMSGGSGTKPAAAASNSNSNPASAASAVSTSTSAPVEAQTLAVGVGVGARASDNNSNSTLLLTRRQDKRFISDENGEMCAMDINKVFSCLFYSIMFRCIRQTCIFFNKYLN